MSCNPLASSLIIRYNRIGDISVFESVSGIRALTKKTQKVKELTRTDCSLCSS